MASKSSKGYSQLGKNMTGEQDLFLDNEIVNNTCEINTSLTAYSASFTKLYIPYSATAPNNPINGEFIFNTASNKLYFYNGGWYFCPMDGRVIIQSAASPPSNPVTGLCYFNTAGNSFNVYNGTAWKSVALT